MNWTFRLRPQTAEESFLVADKRVQQEAVPTLAGFVRRTTARGVDGEWLVSTFWETGADADAAHRVLADDTSHTEFVALIDAPSLQSARFTTLD